MTSNLRAIETLYRGFRFRSRLEARWAVALDRLQVSYRYEPQGFDLGGGIYYLPDFWLPLQTSWLEVKPARGDGADRYFALQKVHGLARQSNRRVLITVGDLPYPYPTIEREAETMIAVFPNGDEDFPYWWCRCPLCGFTGIEYAGRADKLPCGCIGDADAACGFVTSAALCFQEAYEAGRSARFEHSERG